MVRYGDNGWGTTRKVQTVSNGEQTLMFFMFLQDLRVTVQQKYARSSGLPFRKDGNTDDGNLSS